MDSVDTMDLLDAKDMDRMGGVVGSGCVCGFCCWHMFGIGMSWRLCSRWCGGSLRYTFHCSSFFMVDSVGVG